LDDRCEELPIPGWFHLRVGADRLLGFLGLSVRDVEAVPVHRHRGWPGHQYRLASDRPTEVLLSRRSPLWLRTICASSFTRVTSSSTFSPSLRRSPQRSR